jgi:colicin import membrane protein
MADSKDSSVLFSLKELMHLEQTRIAEEYAKVESMAAAERAAHVESERRAREEAAAKLADEDERRHRYEHQRRLEDAELEAAKAMAIEMKRLETQHRLELEARAQQQAHDKQVAILSAARPKASIGPWIFGLAAICVGAMGAIGYVAIWQPRAQADGAMSAAEKLCNSSEASDWERCEEQLAIARRLEPSDPRISPLVDKVATSKREARDVQDATTQQLKRDASSAEAKANDAARQLETTRRPTPIATSAPKTLPTSLPKPTSTTKSKDDKCESWMPLCDVHK